MSDRIEWPRAFTNALESPPLARKPWESGLAPHLIGLFLWVAYFDHLGAKTLPLGGLGWSSLGALVGGLLCFLLLFDGPALWGWKSGRSAEVLGTSTFGASGSNWMIGLLEGLAQVVWIAIGTYYAVEYSLQGLISFRLLDPKYLQPLILGTARVQSPLFLLTALSWSLAAAMVGRYLPRVIAALMLIFPIFPASLLGLAMVLTIQGVRDSPLTRVDLAAVDTARQGGFRALTMTIQWIVGFFATAGLAAPLWGTTCLSRKDVRLAGIVGVAGSAATVAVLSLLTVAGSYQAESLDFSYRAAVMRGVGGSTGGLILMIFGLTSLAPVVYGASLLGDRLHQIGPGFSKTRWVLLGTVAGFPLVATGLAARVDLWFNVMGAIFAPILGVMSADARGLKDEWPGPRAGYNWAGIISCLIGMTVGFLPLVGEAAGSEKLSRFQPAAVFAWVTAYVVYLIGSRVGLAGPSTPWPIDTHSQPAP